MVRVIFQTLEWRRQDDNFLVWSWHLYRKFGKFRNVCLDLQKSRYVTDSFHNLRELLVQRGFYIAVYVLCVLVLVLYFLPLDISGCRPICTQDEDEREVSVGARCGEEVMMLSRGWDWNRGICSVVCLVIRCLALSLIPVPVSSQVNLAAR